jgi:hypothetical protein
MKWNIHSFTYNQWSGHNANFMEYQDMVKFNNGNVEEGSDGILEPLLKVYEPGDGTGAFLYKDDLPTPMKEKTNSNLSVIINGNTKYSGIRPYAEEINGIYYRDNGITLYCNSPIEIWAYFKGSTLYPNTNMRKIAEFQGDENFVEGISIPWIDLFGNASNVSGGTGAMYQIVPIAIESDAILKVAPIPHGSSAEFLFNSQGSEGFSTSKMLATLDKNDYLKWEIPNPWHISEFGFVNWGVNYDNSHDSNERRDKNHIIQEIEGSNNEYEIGEEYNLTLDTTEEIDGVLCLVDEKYSLDDISVNSEQDIETGEWAHTVTFKYQHVIYDSEGEPVGDALSSQMNIKFFINLKY